MTSNNNEPRKAKLSEQEAYNLGVNLIDILAPNGMDGLSQKLVDRFKKAIDFAVADRRLYRSRLMTQLKKSIDDLELQVVNYEKTIEEERNRYRFLLVQDNKKTNELKSDVARLQGAIWAYQQTLLILSQ